MVTPQQAKTKYGNASAENESKYMSFTPVPDDIKAAFAHVKGFPLKNFYCNRDFTGPLLQALRNLVKNNLAYQLKTWDGLYNIRAQRGSNSASLHSWGLAVDVNAGTNQLSTPGDLSGGFVKCFTDAGMMWGGDFKNRKDPMHFELSKLP